MSLGADLTRGVQVGQMQRRITDQRALDALDMIKGRKSGVMGGHISLGGGITAHDIRVKAQQEALDRREQELADNAAKLKAEREQELRNQLEREQISEGINVAKEGRYQTAMEGLGKRREAAEGRAKEYGIQVGKEAAESQDQLLNNAMRGFYAYDADAVKAYFDQHGKAGMSIQGIQRGPNGEVIVDFGEGKQQAFRSPTEAIQMLLLPAAMIMAKTKAVEKGKIPQITEGQKGQRDALLEKYKANLDVITSVIEQDPEVIEAAKKENEEIFGQLGSMGAQDTEGGINITSGMFGTSGTDRVRRYQNKKTGEIIEVRPDGSKTRYMPAEGARSQRATGQIKKPAQRGLNIGKEETPHNFIEYVDKKSGEKRRVEIRDGETVMKKQVNGRWEEIDTNKGINLSITY